MGFSSYLNPTHDPSYEKVPLTILAVKGPYDHWTDRWHVVLQNLDPAEGEELALQGGYDFQGRFKVVSKEIVTEIEIQGYFTEYRARDVVQFLLLENVDPFPTTYPGESIFECLPFTRTCIASF